MKIYIGGNNGVGKTTLTNYFKLKHSEFATFSSSQVIMKTHHLNSREEMRGLQINNELLKEFYLPYKNLLVDGHFYMRDYEKEAFDIFIFMTADPEKIAERRKNDVEREGREQGYESVIKEEKDTINRIIESGVDPVFVLHNDENLDKTLSDLENIIELHKTIKMVGLSDDNDISELAHERNIDLVKDVVRERANNDPSYENFLFRMINRELDGNIEQNLGI